MAREIAESDHSAASERNELCEFHSESQDSLPEITTIIRSHCEVNVGLEAFPRLTSPSVPAKHLHQCEPFNLWIGLSDPRVEIVAVPSVIPRWKISTLSFDMLAQYRLPHRVPAHGSRVAGTPLARASEERRASVALRRGRIKTRARPYERGGASGTLVPGRPPQPQPIDRNACTPRRS
jgi:hypothetical protein